MKWISTVDSTKQEQEKPEEGFRFYEDLPHVFEVDELENWRLSFLLRNWEGSWD